MSTPQSTSRGTKDDQVRANVSRAYTEAVRRPAGGCCGPSVPKGQTARIAGYDAAELASLPQDAVANSFGCGDPLAFAEVRPGDVVVDLGSGAGIDLLLAAERVGPTGRAIGVDMTDAMIERARANVAGSANVEVRKGLIEALPVEDASADWIISNCVINLSPDKPRVFAEIARVLKPGGRMLVSDIVFNGEMPAWIRENAALVSACVGGAIDEGEYLEGLRRAGLADVEVRGRLVYETSQIRGFVEGADVPGLDLSSFEPEALDALLRSVEGKVASIKVYARKPAAA